VTRDDPVTTDVHRRELARLTKTWGARSGVSLYLQRCQVSTPDELVEATWRHVRALRREINTVVDFGAGDGRFARGGNYTSYVGYEIDPALCDDADLPPNARLVNECAFLMGEHDVDLCIGNPPFVRNQDLPPRWRERASRIIHKKVGVTLSGLANAWQYFFFLALATTRGDGLVALVIPYEWVSRPSSKAVRDYITAGGWAVDVYRLTDATFNSVLTTASITIIDKSRRDGRWRFFEENAQGDFIRLLSPSGGAKGVVRYLARRDTDFGGPHAKRGLSPGTQRVLTLTEPERVRSGLRIGRDVVACVTTLRTVPEDRPELDAETFEVYYRAAGRKCWLLRTDRAPSASLEAYIKSIPEEAYQTTTCVERSEWWRFRMPDIPRALIAMSFREMFPKIVRNTYGVTAVGGVYGVYNVSVDEITPMIARFRDLDLRDRIVAHSNGLRKLETGQLNSLLGELLSSGETHGGS
jgi:hypothetical protein